MTSDDLQVVRALIAYVQHKDDCAWIPHEDQPDEWGLREDVACSCALSALLSRWEARQGGEQEGCKRYRMELMVTHQGGDVEIVPVEDQNGEWKRA